MAKKPKFPEGSVCKPCWELHYCPYGYLVEMFPGAGGNLTKTEVVDRHDAALKALMDGTTKTRDDVMYAIEDLTFFQPDNWEEINGYNPEDVNCRIFGHLCPVFLSRCCVTETKESRREGRVIPREMMFKVARRDNHVCQICHQYVPDNQVHFDHIIPYSKGGPTSVANIRLLCAVCNRKKSNSLNEILENRDA